jgi:hypothetical protein
VVRLGLAVNNNLRRNCKTGGFFRLTQILSSLMPYTDKFNRGHFVTDTFCCGDVLLQEKFCYGDVTYVTETFGMETFCQGDILCGDVLYVRP